MANQELREQFEVPKKLKNISCGGLHSITAGHRLDVCRVPMAAQVNKKNLPRRKGLCNIGTVNTPRHPYIEISEPVGKQLVLTIRLGCIMTVKLAVVTRYC